MSDKPADALSRLDQKPHFLECPGCARGLPLTSIGEHWDGQGTLPCTADKREDSFSAATELSTETTCVGLAELMSHSTDDDKRSLARIVLRLERELARCRTRTGCTLNECGGEMTEDLTKKSRRVSLTLTKGQDYASIKHGPHREDSTAGTPKPFASMSRESQDEESAMIEKLRELSALAGEVEFRRDVRGGMFVELTVEMTDRVIGALRANESKLIEMERDAERYRWLKEQAGYLQDGSQTTVTLDQDDATRVAFIMVGQGRSGKYYSSTSFDAAIDAASGKEG